MVENKCSAKDLFRDIANFSLTYHTNLYAFKMYLACINFLMFEIREFIISGGEWRWRQLQFGKRL